MACRLELMTLALGVSLACGPGLPKEKLGSDAGDGDAGDGDPGDGDPSGDGDPGTTGDPWDSGDPSGDSSDMYDNNCAALGFLMAPCDGVSAGCLDDWTCHFYDSVDIYGISPVGNCSPPCEADADCEWMGMFGGTCSDRNIVCEPYGADGVPRCILPCQVDGDCYSSQYCDEDLGLCLSNST